MVVPVETGCDMEVLAVFELAKRPAAFLLDGFHLYLQDPQLQKKCQRERREGDEGTT